VPCSAGSAPPPCANGVNDTVFAIADTYLLIDHGVQKTARFYPGGHAGGSDARAAIVSW